MERSDGPREWRSRPSSKSKRRASMDKRRAPSGERGTPVLPAKVFGVSLRESLPLFRQVIQRENRRHGAHGNTSSAIDALNRVDVQHFLFGERGRILLRMDTIDWTSVHTSSVLGADARFCNYVCHKVCVSLKWLRNLTEPLILTRMQPAVQHSAGFSTHPLTLAPHLARIRRCDPPLH